MEEEWDFRLEGMVRYTSEERHCHAYNTFFKGAYSYQSLEGMMRSSLHLWNE
jgi:hypothetical protein